MALRSAAVEWTAILGSSLLLVLALPPVGLWPAVLASAALLALGLERVGVGRAFVLGWGHGVVLGLGGAHWLAHPLLFEYELGAPAAFAVVGGLVMTYALVHAMGIASWALLRTRVAPAMAPLVLAACFVGFEWLRGDLLSLPWLLAAHSVGRVPLLIQGAALGGVWLVGFALIAAGAGMGHALARASWWPGLVGAFPLLALVAFGATRLASGPLPADLEVAVVQADVPQAERFQPDSAWRNTRKHVEWTRGLLDQGAPDLVVWSENSVDAALDQAPGVELGLLRLSDTLDVPIVTGVPRRRGRALHNAVVLFAPGRGLAETYVKQKLVPFSEYDPAWGAWLEPLLGPVTEGEPYRSGDDATVFRAGPRPLAAPICFEITDEVLVRRFRDGGAELLLNLSNDAWFGQTAFLEHHLRHAVFRAVELGVFVVRAANTGISAIVDPRGRVLGSLAAGQEGVLRGHVGPAEALPFHARWGSGPFLLALLVLVAGSLAAGRIRRPAAR